MCNINSDVSNECQCDALEMHHIDISLEMISLLGISVGTRELVDVAMTASSVIARHGTPLKLIMKGVNLGVSCDTAVYNFEAVLF